MKKGTARIDLMKLAMYLLKRCWIIIICAAIGFGYMYWRASDHRDTYTSSGTMIVENNNPNTRNIGYYSASDSYSAQELWSWMSIIGCWTWRRSLKCRRVTGLCLRSTSIFAKIWNW